LIGFIITLLGEIIFKPSFAWELSHIIYAQPVYNHNGRKITQLTALYELLSAYLVCYCQGLFDGPE